MASFLAAHTLDVGERSSVHRRTVATRIRTRIIKLLPSSISIIFYYSVTSSFRWNCRQSSWADASYYHTLIGVLRWIVELGRIDIDVEVSMMSSHLALPREGHLKELYHIFAYLKVRSNAEMVFDPTPIEPDKTLFERQDRSYSAYGYESLKEELPSDIPVPHGQSMMVRVFVDADHAGDQVTH
jgi:hypothetical protein